MVSVLVLSRQRERFDGFEKIHDLGGFIDYRCIILGCRIYGLDFLRTPKNRELVVGGIVVGLLSGCASGDRF